MSGTSKSVFVSIVGKPNVGKSSLLNRLVGEKVAIVSPKPQTTRTRITGILTEGPVQFVFIDTPGLHQSKTKLGNYMVEQVRQSVADVDVIALVVEPEGKMTQAEEKLLEDIKKSGIPAVLLINKMDQVKNRDLLLTRIAFFRTQFDFAEYLPVSAFSGEGIPTLKETFLRFGEEGPHYFPDDEMTDQPEKILAAEMIREKMLYFLNEEVPHGVGVILESMKERKNGKILDIEATIYCERKGHKGIIIGKDGAMLKKIGEAARKDLESFFGIHINLQLWVKVKENWRNKEGIMRSLGYEGR